MSDDLTTLVRFRLELFFSEVTRLTRRDLRRVEQTAGATSLTRVGLELDPEFLAAVASGAWTHTHQVLADEARMQARACARQRASFVGRRRLSRALEDAAIALLSDCDPAQPLPQSLCARLAGPWTHASGLDPKRFARAA